MLADLLMLPFMALVFLGLCAAAGAMLVTLVTATGVLMGWVARLIVAIVPDWYWNPKTEEKEE